MPDYRENIVTFVCGRKRTGKTTFINRLIRQHKKKVLIVDVNGEKAYSDISEIELHQIPRFKKGMARIFPFDKVDPDIDLTNQLLKSIYTNMSNTLVVFEDATMYFPFNTDGTTKRLLAGIRHRNVDVIFTFHSLKLVPVFMYQMGNYIELFKTNDDVEGLRSNKNKISNYNKVVETFNQVQQHPNQYHHQTVNLLV